MTQFIEIRSVTEIKVFYNSSSKLDSWVALMSAETNWLEVFHDVYIYRSLSKDEHYYSTYTPVCACMCVFVQNKIDWDMNF